jgi:Uma2 family endonuclease
MSIDATSEAPPQVDYPESDGLPMADNEVQYEWIVTIKGGLDAVLRDKPDVYVAGNMFWYSVEGDNKTVMAPDAMVAFGRPKTGRRGSYLQWVEGGIAPQVIFDIISPSNRFGEMFRKYQFYQQFGVEEYYLYDPNKVELLGWLRDGRELREIPEMSGWISPRLGIRFEIGDDLTIFGPDGRPFATYLEVIQQRDQSDQRADEEHRRAEEERLRADEEHRRAEEEHRHRVESDLRAERLAAKLRELGLNPDE